jgi:Mrp family chromosome partitioning ATPase
MIKIRAILRRRWKLLLFGLVVGALAGAASSAMAPEKGETSYRVSQLIVANRAAGTQGLVEQDALRVTRGEVANKAAETLGVDDPQKASSGIAATADTDSGSIEVTATSADPDMATARAEAFVGAFLSVVNADLLADQEARFAELQAQIDDSTAALTEFDAQNPDLSLAAVGGNPVVLDQLVGQRSELESQVQTSKDELRRQRLEAKSTLPYSTLGADAPKAVDTDLLPVPTSLPFRAGLLGLFGVALAAGAVMVIERIAPRIDTRAELVAVADYPVLSEVGDYPAKAQPHEGDGSLSLDGAWAEPYRRIRSAIQFVQSRSAASGQGGAQQSFLVASPSPGDGKSTTAAVTAMALAETGQLTLVIGGDFRRPRVHELLGVPAHPGIRDYAQIAMERPTVSQVVQPSSHANLYVAPAGAPSKEIAGLAEATREIAEQAVEQGATVIIDSSPLEVANDTIDLLPAADAVIMLVRSGHTAVKTLEHSIEMLTQHGATIMGLVLIGTPGLSKRQYYYEGYYTTSTPKGGPWPVTPAAPDGGTAEQASPRKADRTSPPPFMPDRPAGDGEPLNGRGVDERQPAGDHQSTGEHAPGWSQVGDRPGPSGTTHEPPLR